MKTAITSAYTFTPGVSGVGTVNLSGISGFDIRRLYAIINATKGQIIYAVGQAAFKYTAVSGTTVTLFYNTSTMSNTDSLMVIYDDTTALDVNVTGGSITVGANTVSTVNSSTTPLAAAATFTGASEDLLNYNSIGIAVATDYSGTIYIDFSSNGTNWDHTESYAVTPPTPGTVFTETFGIVTQARYYRVRYLNDGTNQGVFRLQTILKTVAPGASVSDLSIVPTDNTDSLHTKSIIYGKTTGGGGGYVAVKVNPSGALTVDATQSGTWNINDISGTISLPTGAATSANQTNGSQITQITASGTALTATGSSLNVNVTNADLDAGTPGGALPSAAVYIAGTDGTNLRGISVDNTGKANINNISGTISLPTGAATSANQTTTNTSLSAIQTALTLAQGSTTSGQTGNLQLAAVTTAAPTYTTGTTNPLSLTTAGALRTDSSATTQPISGTVTANAGTGNFTVVQATAANLNAQVVGNVAAGSADSGNPVKIGGLAKTAQPTAVTDGQRANILTDKLGRVVTAPGHIRDLVTQQATTITNSSAETTFLTAVANTFLDITSLVITNQSNQSVVATIKDATAGTTRATFALAASGGIVVPLPVPWKQSVVNNNWTITLSANNVTVHVFAIALQNI